MRIALLTTTFLPVIGGAEFTIHNLASQWASSGHDVCVINSITADKMYPCAGYAVRRYTLLRGARYCLGLHRNPFRWYAAHKIKKILKDWKPDLISAHMAYPCAIWMSAMRPAQKFIITCHGADITDDDGGYRKRYRIDAVLSEALNSALKVIAVSSHACRLLKNLGVHPSKIAEIPNGVDVKRHQKKVKKDIRMKYGIPAAAVLILSVGRQSPAKDFTSAINAFAKLSKKEPSAYCLITGRGTGSLRLQASRQGLQENIIFSEGLFGDELVAAYQQSDILFSSSRREFCPLVVLEAMASGLPAVVTNVGGSQDMIQSGINGLVVEPGDTDGMAEALSCLVKNRDLRVSFGRESIKRSRHCSWEDISRRYLECVNKAGTEAQRKKWPEARG